MNVLYHKKAIIKIANGDQAGKQVELHHKEALWIGSDSECRLRFQNMKEKLCYISYDDEIGCILVYSNADKGITFDKKTSFTTGNMVKCNNGLTRLYVRGVGVIELQLLIVSEAIDVNPNKNQYEISPINQTAQNVKNQYKTPRVNNNKKRKIGKICFACILVLACLLMLRKGFLLLRHYIYQKENPVKSILYYSHTAEEDIVTDEVSGHTFAGNELLVQMQTGTSEAEAIKTAEKNNAELVGLLGNAGICQWRYENIMSYDELCELAEDIRKIDGVEAVSINYADYETTSASADVPDEGPEWDAGITGLENYAWGYKISGGVYAWQNRDLLTDPVKIAIIDNGYGKDDELYSEDVSFQPMDNLTSDGLHAIEVMGIMAAKCDNDLGIAGIYPYGYGNVLAYQMSTTMEILYDAEAAVKEDGAKVVNMSLGYYHEAYDYDEAKTPLDEDVVEMANAVIHGLVDEGYEFLFVEAAGNS